MDHFLAIFWPFFVIFDPPNGPQNRLISNFIENPIYIKLCPNGSRKRCQNHGCKMSNALPDISPAFFATHGRISYVPRRGHRTPSRGGLGFASTPAGGGFPLRPRDPQINDDPVRDFRPFLAIFGGTRGNGKIDQNALRYSVSWARRARGVDRPLGDLHRRWRHPPRGVGARAPRPLAKRRARGVLQRDNGVIPMMCVMHHIA